MPSKTKPSAVRVSIEKSMEDNRRIRAGELPVEGIREAYAAHKERLPDLTAELQAMTAAELRKMGAGGYHAKQMVKSQLVDDLIRRFHQVYVLRAFSWSPMTQQYLAAVDEHVAEQTAEDLAKYVEKCSADDAERAAFRAKALKTIQNPETYEELHHKAQYVGGYEKLSPEEKIRYDEQRAIVRRKERPQRAKDLQGLEGGVEVTGETKIVKGRHTRLACDTWTVTVAEHLGDAFRPALERAKALGGNFVSKLIAANYGCASGFQFFAEAAALEFQKSLAGEDVDLEASEERREERRRQTQAARLRERADAMHAAATDELTRVRQENTHKRASHAESARKSARRDLALAGTLAAISEAAGRDEVVHLKGVRAVAHVRELRLALDRAKWQSLHADRETLDALPYEARESRYAAPPLYGDIAYATYPYPRFRKAELSAMSLYFLEAPGLKRIGQQLFKLAKAAKDPDEPIVVDDRDTLAKLNEAVRKLRGRRGLRRTSETVEREVESVNRLRAMDIVDAHELRAALREYHRYVEAPEHEPEIERLEREVRFQKIPGFFPTPRPLIDRMLDLADLRPGMSVLEPSAGKGDICDAVREREPYAEIFATESHTSLAKICEAKGYDVRWTDFLVQASQHDRLYPGWPKRFDRVLMNPPFEDGQAIRHVRTAFKLLGDLGRLVAVIPGHEQAYREAKASARREFAEFVDQHGWFEELPDGSFAGAEAFRQTGVSTSLVVLDKS